MFSRVILVIVYTESSILLGFGRRGSLALRLSGRSSVDKAFLRVPLDGLITNIARSLEPHNGLGACHHCGQFIRILTPPRWQCSLVEYSETRNSNTIIFLDQCRKHFDEGEQNALGHGLRDTGLFGHLFYDEVEQHALLSVVLLDERKEFVVCYFEPTISFELSALVDNGRFSHLVICAQQTNSFTCLGRGGHHVRSPSKFSCISHFIWCDNGASSGCRLPCS